MLILESVPPLVGVK